jgi:hypothetical protein
MLHRRYNRDATLACYGLALYNYLIEIQLCEVPQLHRFTNTTYQDFTY